MILLAVRRPLIASLETDSLSIQFVLSTNADDPAGIQREQKPIQQDVKPRLSQARLTSLGPLSQQQQQQQSRQSSRAPSVMTRNGSATPGPASSADRGKGKPLFQPKDDDDDDDDNGQDETSLDMQIGAGSSRSSSSRRIATNRNSRATPIDLDNEDELWAEVDEQDPSFSQHALALSQVPLPNRPRGEDSIAEEQEEEIAGRPQSTQLDGRKRKGGQQERQMETEGISLDPEEEESIDMAEEEQDSSTTKRAKQVCTAISHIM